MLNRWGMKVFVVTLQHSFNKREINSTYTEAEAGALWQRVLSTVLCFPITCSFSLAHSFTHTLKKIFFFFYSLLVHFSYVKSTLSLGRRVMYVCQTWVIAINIITCLLPLAIWVAHICLLPGEVKVETCVEAVMKQTVWGCAAEVRAWDTVGT